jgi:hypothetical protein
MFSVDELIYPDIEHQLKSDVGHIKLDDIVVDDDDDKHNPLTDDSTQPKQHVPDQVMPVEQGTIHQQSSQFGALIQQQSEPMISSKSDDEDSLSFDYHNELLAAARNEIANPDPSPPSAVEVVSINDVDDTIQSESTINDQDDGNELESSQTNLINSPIQQQPSMLHHSLFPLSSDSGDPSSIPVSQNVHPIFPQFAAQSFQPFQVYKLNYEY